MELETRKRLGKLWLRWVLAALAVLLLAMAAVTALMVRAFPQREILPEELYGAEQENLKDFTLGEDGWLTAQSDDPWVYFDFGEAIRLRQITVYLSGVEGSGQTLVVYLAPSYTTVSVPLQAGDQKLTLSWDMLRQGITGIRLDLAQVSGTRVQVERVVLNSYSFDGLWSMLSGFFLFFLVLFPLAAAEAWLWIEVLCRREEGRARSRRRALLRGAPAVAQGVVKLFLALLVALELEDGQSGGSTTVLCWMLALGVEATTLGMLLLRRFGRQRSLLWGMALLPLWSTAMFSLVELLAPASFTFQSIRYLLLNLLCCCAVGAVLMLLLRWGPLALSLATGLFTVWGLANHYFSALRNNPLELSDLLQAGTAANVVSNYELTLDSWVMVSVLTLAVLALGAFSALGAGCWTWGWRQNGAGVLAAAAAVCLFGAVLPDYDINQAWDLPSVSGRYGYLLSFFSYAEASTGDGKPEGYTAELADSILEEAANGGTSASAGELAAEEDDGADLPNIIVIMDESFADLPGIYGFDTDVDPLSNIHALEEDTITGSLLVSVFGGGTSNTEYEFLTGNSLHILPMNCCPYVQYMSSQQQSIAWHLQNLGYSTAAYHPFQANGYRREANYPLLGLDPFYSISSGLPYQEYLRSYISDQSDFQNIIYLYEQRQEGQPFFLFNVTMQNHGGYSSESPAVEVTVQPESEELCTVQMLEYLSLIHATDEAFGELVDYFSQVEEDTIILLFGDHQPSLDSATLDAMNGQYDGESALVETGNLSYLTSFVLWANFDIDEATDVLTSPNYLRAILLDQAGVPLSAYEQFLLQLYEVYPAMNYTSYLDSTGQWHLRGEAEDELLEDYAVLVYNNVFDKKHMTEQYYD